jgi:hypothetical protein
VSETIEAVAGAEPARRIRRTAEEKLRVVEATFRPGASPIQRCFSATDCKGEAHAGHRTGVRLFGRTEVSVGIDVDQTHRSLRGFPRTQKGSQHDAAIAAQHDCKTAVA